MRHWPPLQSLLVLGALGLLLIPLLKLTAPGTSARITPSSESSTPTQIEAQAILRFAHPPERFTVMEGPTLVWAKGDPTDLHTAEFETTLRLHPDGGMVDLGVTVSWPPGTPRTVVELELLPAGSEGSIRTAWGEGELSTFFALPIE